MAANPQPPAKKPTTKQSAWKALASHYKTVSRLHLRQLFADDSKRGQRMVVDALGLYLDYSKNRVTDETLKLLVQLAEESVHTAGREMKVAKMLSPETDTNALANRAFMHLPGVTDEWIKTLEVEKIAGAQVSPDEDIRLIAALIQKDTSDSCCRRKMFDQPDQEAPNLADPDAPCLNTSTVAAER